MAKFDKKNRTIWFLQLQLFTWLIDVWSNRIENGIILMFSKFSWDYCSSVLKELIKNLATVTCDVASDLFFSTS